MTQKTMKPFAIWTAIFVLTLFFLAEGAAWSGATPQQASGKAVTGQIPPKPGIPAAKPPLSQSGKAIASKTGDTNPNSSPSSCPLTLAAGPKGDIRDIRGPIHIPDPLVWLFYGLGGILLLLLAFAIWKWLRKKHVLHSKKAFEIAFEELEKAKALMTPEMAERFSVMVSRTIRTYIEKRFQMTATRKTTHEFISQVAAEPSSELNQHHEPLRKFLDHCDLAKFARQTFSKDQMRKMHRSAWRFVEETRPQPEEEKRDKSASPMKDVTAAEQTIKNSISGRKRFFRDRFKCGFKCFTSTILKSCGCWSCFRSWPF